MIPISDLIILMILALLIFGPRRLPEIGRMVGKGLAEFRRASNELRRSISAELAVEEDDAAARTRSADFNRPTLLPPPAPMDAAASQHRVEAASQADPPASVGVPGSQAPGSLEPGSPAAPELPALSPEPSAGSLETTVSSPEPSAESLEPPAVASNPPFLSTEQPVFSSAPPPPPTVQPGEGGGPVPVAGEPADLPLPVRPE